MVTVIHSLKSTYTRRAYQRAVVCQTSRPGHIIIITVCWWEINHFFAIEREFVIIRHKTYSWSELRTFFTIEKRRNVSSPRVVRQCVFTIIIISLYTYSTYMHWKTLKYSAILIFRLTTHNMCRFVNYDWEAYIFRAFSDLDQLSHIYTTLTKIS